MKQIILVILFLLYLSQCTAQAHPRLYTYLLTADEEGARQEKDTCLIVKSVPIIDDTILIHFDGGDYFFNLWTYDKSNEFRLHRHKVVRYSGLATYLGQPYTISHTTYGDRYYIIIIMPLRFTWAHNINRLRTFIYTNDERQLKHIKCCKL